MPQPEVPHSKDSVIADMLREKVKGICRDEEKIERHEHPLLSTTHIVGEVAFDIENKDRSIISISYRKKNKLVVQKNSIEIARRGLAAFILEANPACPDLEDMSDDVLRAQEMVLPPKLNQMDYRFQLIEHKIPVSQAQELCYFIEASSLCYRASGG